MEPLFEFPVPTSKPKTNGMRDAMTIYETRPTYCVTSGKKDFGYHVVEANLQIGCPKIVW